MGIKKELLFNTIIIGIGKFSTQIISVLLLPMYTSILSTEEYGTYDLIYTISIFLLPIITLLMEESMFRFLIDCKNKEEKSKIISQTFIYTIISTIIASIIILLVGFAFHIDNIWLIALYILSSIIIGLRNAITRGFSKIKLYSIMNFVTSALIIILNILFVAYLRIGIKGLLLSSIIANAITSTIIFFKLKVMKYISFKNYDKKTMKEMIKYSIPLVPNSLSWTIINFSDRLIITSVLGTSANGIYSIACKFPTMMDSIYGFFYTAWKEAAAKAKKDDDTDKFYDNIYQILKKLLYSIVLGLIAVLPFAFSWLIKKEFENAYYYIPVLLVAMYFSNISGFYGGIFSAYKETKIMGTTTILSAILNIVVNIAIIHFVGLWAGAISTLVSVFVVYLLRKRQLKKFTHLSEKKEIFSAIVFIVAIVSYYYKNTLLNASILIIAILYCAYLNKEIIISIMSYLKSKLNGQKV